MGITFFSGFFSLWPMRPEEGVMDINQRMQAALRVPAAIAKLSAH
jgi:hypothetical protein